MYQQVLSSPLVSLGASQPHLVPSVTACPFLGEIYQPALNVTQNSIWQDAVVDLTDTIAELTYVRLNHTSVAIQIVSPDETSPIYEYYKTVAGQLYGDDDHAPVDGDTVFRIASTSKMLAVYALLLECDFQCFDDPITKYMPELKDQDHSDETKRVDWEEVRVGALASHMAGIGRDYALADAAYSPFATIFGLPRVEQINQTQIPKCGVNPALPSCGRKETIDLLLDTMPIFANYRSPAYSNMAFQLLGYVIENITALSFEDAMIKSVFEPLKMSRSSVSPPKNASVTIRNPLDPLSDWDYGDQAPFGGIFSSTSDLARHALAVLNHSQLTPSQTRRWLRPVTHSSSLFLSFGMPWEITRQRVAGEYTVDTYCKGGNMGPYSTEYCIVPDLQVAFIVNAITIANQPGITAMELADVIGKTIIKPLTEIGKQQAMARFAGRYVYETSGASSSLLVTTDDSIGLVIGEWMSNGVNVLYSLRALGIVDGTVRLFPASLTSKNSGRVGVEKVAFRAVMNPRNSPYEGCINWGTVDGLRFAGLPMDAFIFEVETDTNGTARARSVNLPAYRATYERVDIFMAQQSDGQTDA